MTKKEMFANIATLLADNAEVVDFCNHEISLLENRKTSKGLTKTQKDNEVIMEKIALALSAMDEPVTVTELITSGNGLEGLTNQKVSALLRKMIEDGQVEKIIEKKKAFFHLIG